MIWFFTREGHDRRSCETRLAFDGNGYELVVREGDRMRIERFHELGSLLARQQELLLAWQSLGWQGLPDRDKLSAQ